LAAAGTFAALFGTMIAALAIINHRPRQLFGAALAVVGSLLPSLMGSFAVCLGVLLGMWRRAVA
jgi:hypothetical protein